MQLEVEVLISRTQDLLWAVIHPKRFYEIDKLRFEVEHEYTLRSWNENVTSARLIDQELRQISH